MKPKEQFNQDKARQEQSGKDKGTVPTPEQDKERQRLLDENKAVPNPTFPHSADEEEEGPKPLKLKADEAGGSED